MRILTGLLEDAGRVKEAGVLEASSGAEVGLVVLCYVERAGRAVVIPAGVSFITNETRVVFQRPQR